MLLCCSHRPARLRRTRSVCCFFAAECDGHAAEFCGASLARRFCAGRCCEIVASCRRASNQTIKTKSECVVKLRLRDNESVQDAVKRFRKLVEHAGIKKEMRRREYYEKPSDVARRQRRRAERRARINRLTGR